jgi:hypothetical protein
VNRQAVVAFVTESQGNTREFVWMVCILFHMIVSLPTGEEDLLTQRM